MLAFLLPSVNLLFLSNIRTTLPKSSAAYTLLRLVPDKAGCKAIALTDSAIPIFCLRVLFRHSANISAVLRSTCAFRPIYCAVYKQTYCRKGIAHEDCAILAHSSAKTTVLLRNLVCASGSDSVSKKGRTDCCNAFSPINLAFWETRNK